MARLTLLLNILRIVLESEKCQSLFFQQNRSGRQWYLLTWHKTSHLTHDTFSPDTTYLLTWYKKHSHLTQDTFSPDTRGRFPHCTLLGKSQTSFSWLNSKSRVQCSCRAAPCKHSKYPRQSDASATRPLLMLQRLSGGPTRPAERDDVWERPEGQEDKNVDHKLYANLSAWIQALVS